VGAVFAERETTLLAGILITSLDYSRAEVGSDERRGVPLGRDAATQQM